MGKRQTSQCCIIIVNIASYAGLPSRYTYVAQSGTVDDSEDAFFVGITKVDLKAESSSKAVAGSILYGGQWVGGEPIFVPRKTPLGA
jgi:carotenoid cleavage dioxygenase-like enzyme